MSGAEISSETPQRGLAQATVLSSTRGAAQALTFGTAVLMARAFPVDDYGRFALAQAVASVFIVVLDHGSQFLLVQKGASSPATIPVRFGQAWTVRHGLALLAIPVLLVMAWLDPEDVRRLGVTAIALAGSIFDADLLLAFTAFRLTGRFGLESFWTLAGGILRFGLTALVLVTRQGFMTMVAALSLGKLSIALGALVQARQQVPFPWRPRSSPGIVSHLRESLPFGAFALAGIAYFQSGTIVVSAWGGNREAALYQSALMLYFGGLLFPDALSTATFPRLAELWVRDRPRFFSEWRRLVGRLFLVGLALCGAIVFAGPRLLHLLLPPAYEPARAVLTWLGVAMLVRCVSYGVGTGLHAGGRQIARAVNFVAALAAIIVLGSWAASVLGALGMAMAMVGVEVLLLVLEAVTAWSIVRSVRHSEVTR